MSCVHSDEPLLAEHLPIFVWAARSDGGSDYYNAPFLSYLGRTLAEMGPMTWAELVHPEDREAALAGWARALREGAPYEIEVRVRRASDGAYRWFLCRARPVRGADGAVVRWAGVAIDVHEHVQAEQERDRLLQNAQAARASAEAASRAKDDFLAIVSHELRTPLHAILGWAQILTARSLQDDAQARAIATIERNARLQARLIEDILDASRIAAGKIHLEARPIAIAPIVKSAIEALKPAADREDIQLSATLDPQAGPVLGDPSRIQQVAWNLISNAVKFTPRRGHVTVTLEAVEGEARLVVRDTGIGIGAEFLPHVFEPFRQADPSTSRRHGGLGLGLSIVRQLVQLHGGTVEIESPGEGQGTMVTVRLPLLSEEAGPSASWSASANAVLSRLDGARVLVVDDEPDSRALLEKVLADRGALVRTCASAGEALEQVSAWRPDVLVSDIGMPERDGYWLIDQVRALPPDRGGDTPALALTGFASVEDRVRALSRGFHLHASKPVDAAELLASVAALVREPSWRAHGGPPVG
ncbi:MAG: ATP-binding protein [Minicystis sp.]